MDELDDPTLTALGLSPDAVRALVETREALRSTGASFAFLHGRTVRTTSGPGSDVDVAAWWAGAAPAGFEVLLPTGVDLLVLNGAPPELAGRIALEGVLLFDDDPVLRVRWLARTRTVCFDERPRIERSHRELAESLHRGR